MDAEWVGIGVSAVLSAAALFVAVRQGHKANKAAERSTLAAERSTVAAERSAAAAENAVRLAEAEASRYTVPWRLSWAGGDSYRLDNDGDEDALDVDLSSHETLEVIGQRQFARFGAREGVTFITARDFGTEDDRLTVTWTRPGDSERLTWRSPIPWA